MHHIKNKFQKLTFLIACFCITTTYSVLLVNAIKKQLQETQEHIEEIIYSMDLEELKNGQTNKWRALNLRLIKQINYYNAFNNKLHKKNNVEENNESSDNESFDSE